MSQIKLLLTDIDGTLVESGTHNVSPKVRQAVLDCEAHGIRVAAVTGRPIEMARPVLEILGFQDLCVFDNGATIANPITGEIVWSRLISPESLRQVCLSLLPDCINIDYAPTTEQHEPAANEAAIIANWKLSAASIFVLIDPSKVASVSRKLDAFTEISYYVGVDGRLYNGRPVKGVQISPVDGDKFHGVTALRNLNNVSKLQTAAIGDHINDLPLFHNSGLNFAMGNATDELKAVADHVVADVDHDGFAEAVYRYVLS